VTGCFGWDNDGFKQDANNHENMWGIEGEGLILKLQCVASSRLWRVITSAHEKRNEPSAYGNSGLLTK